MATTQTATTCPRHPGVETNLRCASCGELICPKCLVQTPVGMKCRTCGLQKGGKLFTLSPLQIACGSGVGLALGAFAGLGANFLGWYSIFIAVAYGGFAGEMIRRAAGRKSGTKLEVLAGITLAVGAIGGRILVASLPSSLGISRAMIELVLPSPFPLISLLIAISTAVSRIRYI